MKINFSTHFQALADEFGDCDALAHPERGRRYAFREFHLLSNRVINMLRATLGLQAGDRFLNILENDNLSLLHAPTTLKCNVVGRNLSTTLRHC